MEVIKQLGTKKDTNVHSKFCASIYIIYFCGGTYIFHDHVYIEDVFIANMPNYSLKKAISVVGDENE